jgi:hypothetical protein
LGSVGLFGTKSAAVLFTVLRGLVVLLPALIQPMAAVGANDVRCERLLVLRRSLRLEAAAMPAMSSLEEGRVRPPAVLSFGVLLRALLMSSLFRHALLPMGLEPLRGGWDTLCGQGEGQELAAQPGLPIF